MQATHHSITGFAFIILHETHLTDLFKELPLRERLEEIATVVTENLGFDDEHIGDLGVDYFHMALYINKK